MRSFYVSLAVFALLLFIIVWNSIFVQQTTDNLIALLTDLPDCDRAERKFEHLEEFWEAREWLVALTASRADIESVSEQLIQMRSAVQTGDTIGFERARALAIEAAHHLHHLEEISLDNLL